MNAWDRTKDVRKRTESFTKVIQGPKETFIDFFQRLTSAINRMIPNSEARQKIIEFLLLKMLICKTVIRPLKVRLAPLEEWIQDTVNIESHNHDDA